MEIDRFINKMPKVELHYHLDGGVRSRTVVDLAEQQGIKLPCETAEQLDKWFHRGADRKNLALYLQCFAVTLSVMQTREAIVRVAREAIEDMAAQNVVYAEIRFAPILSTQKELNLEQVVKAVLDGLNDGKRATGVEFSLILCAMRDQSPKVSLETAELAVIFREHGVRAFDIAGDEYGHPPKKHLKAFQYIRNKNFSITIHAGEAFGPESIWQAVQICGAHRIGHGVRLIEDITTVDGKIVSMGSLAGFVRDRRIPLELCLSSNLHTGAVPSIKEHPFGLLYHNDFRVTLCTDNITMSNTSICKEFMLAADAFSLGPKDLEKITINSIKSAFINYRRRLELIYDVIKPAFARLNRKSE